MMMKEFEELTGIYPDDTTYRFIEEEYYVYEGDKKQFCKDYMGNTNNLAVRIRNKTNEFQNELIRTYTEQATELKDRLEKLGQKLEKEEEWRPYGTFSKMSKGEYSKLENSCDGEAGEEQLREIIEKVCNFDYQKVRIIKELDTFEVNRHNQLRVTGKEKRAPLYYASDWNYIRFDSGSYQYEYINGTLRFYEG